MNWIDKADYAPSLHLSHCQEELKYKLTCWIKYLMSFLLDIVCLMETCVFPKDRALVNVQKLAFCVQSNAEENIFAT